MGVVGGFLLVGQNWSDEMLHGSACFNSMIYIMIKASDKIPNK